MKMRNTLILLIILMALAVYVYLVEFRQYEQKEQVKKESKKLFSLVKDSVEVLEFSNLNGSFAVKRIQDQWKITRPLYTEADESTINSMITSLLGAEKETEFTILPHQLPDYGLGTDAVRVKVTGRGRVADSLRLGEGTPVGAFVFSSKSDSLVVTTNQSVKTSFEKTLFDIRDKKLLHFKRDEVRKIMVRRPQETIEFEKSGISDWIIRNIDRPADNGKISSILNKLENNRVKNFVDEEGTVLREFGLSSPAYELDLVLGPELGKKRLSISRQMEGIYYARDDSRKPVFEIDSLLVQDIRQKVSEFRNKDLASFDRNAINRLRIAYGDTLFTCVKDTADRWFLETVNGDLIVEQKIRSFFSNLDYTNITEFVKDGNVNLAAYGLDRPVLTVSLFADEALVLEVIVGKRKDDSVHVMTNQYESVYLIPESKVKDFRLRLDEILEKPTPAEDGVTRGE